MTTPQSREAGGTVEVEAEDVRRLIALAFAGIGVTDLDARDFALLERLHHALEGSGGLNG